jgi:hypothetical protein
MRDRCNNPKADRYPRYGGRGIRVCARWQTSFENFLADMGPCPDGMSIERKDNDSDYEPANCLWATNEQQANHRSNNRLVTFKGETMSVARWARRIGISRAALQSRIDRDWPIELALTPSATRRPPKKEKTSKARRALCAECGAEFVAETSRSRFCSATCRTKKCKRDWYERENANINERRRARAAAKRAPTEVENA